MLYIVLILQDINTCTCRYSGVNVTNFHTSWRDGMAFCALIHSQSPHLLDYESCDPLQPVDNLEKAFSIAEKELNVTRLLEPEGKCTVTIVFTVKPCNKEHLQTSATCREVVPFSEVKHCVEGQVYDVYTCNHDCQTQMTEILLILVL